MEIHHFGYLTKDIDLSISNFLFDGFKIEKNKIKDEIRKCSICFLTNCSYRIELIQPIDNASPIFSLLKKYNGTFYHICYICDNLKTNVENLVRRGYKVMIEECIAPALDNRKVVFLISNDFNIIELVER